MTPILQTRTPSCGEVGQCVLCPSDAVVWGCQTGWVSGSGDSAPGQRCQMPPFLPSPQVTSSPALLPHRRPYSQATTEPALTHTPSSGRPVVSPPLPALGISPGTMTLGVPDALGTF